MKMYHLIEQLRMSSLTRLGMTLAIYPQGNMRETPKIRADIRKAKKENLEADLYINRYIRTAKRVDDGNVYHMGGEYCVNINCKKKEHLPF